MFENILGGKKEELKERAVRKEGYDATAKLASVGAAMQNDQAYVMGEERRSDLIRWQQEMEAEMEGMIQRLRGYECVGGKWVPIKVKIWTDGGLAEVDLPPLCNDLFISQVVIPQCQPFLSKNIFNTNLDEEMILKMLKRTMNTVVSAMSDGYDVYDIEFRDFDLIDSEIRNMIIPSPFRSLQGWNKRMDNSATRRVETLSGDLPNAVDRKSLFSGVK